MQSGWTYQGCACSREITYLRRRATLRWMFPTFTYVHDARYSPPSTSVSRCVLFCSILSFQHGSAGAYRSSAKSVYEYSNMTQPQPDSAPQFPGGMHISGPPRCCCGRNHCAYLEYNDAALRGLEDDLRRAAEAGQVRL